jgi:hypothetical protein
MTIHIYGLKKLKIMFRDEEINFKILSWGRSRIRARSRSRSRSR